MENFNKICGMGPADILKKAVEPIIQPDSNIGEPGEIQSGTVDVQITKDEEGNIKVTTPAICVKLTPPVIKALEIFLSTERETSDGNAN